MYKNKAHTHNNIASPTDVLACKTGKIPFFDTHIKSRILSMENIKNYLELKTSEPLSTCELFQGSSTHLSLNQPITDAHM